MGKMFTNRCINIINILTSKKLKRVEKVKLASFYLDGMVLYWHQNFTRSLGGRDVTWEEYIEALCG
jgi:hypothetical protein